CPSRQSRPGAPRRGPSSWGPSSACSPTTSIPPSPSSSRRLSSARGAEHRRTRTNTDEHGQAREDRDPRPCSSVGGPCPSVRSLRVDSLPHRVLHSAGSSGAVAQLGERLNGIQEVEGSTPFGSTNLTSS